MSSLGYECRNCGHTPDEEELSHGSCPNCSESRRHAWKTLPGVLEKLPIGSSIQVLKRRFWWVGSVQHSVDWTLFLWTLTERDLEGKAVWRGHLGSTQLVDALGLDRAVYVQGYAETRYHDPLRMVSDAVSHFTTGEMTYGAWYVIHDVTPTDKALSFQRMMEDMGWPPARAA
jgi:hypothetical protein